MHNNPDEYGAQKKKKNDRERERPKEPRAAAKMKKRGKYVPFNLLSRQREAVRQLLVHGARASQNRDNSIKGKTQINKTK